jgi:CDP-diacylglycerol--glycerol-3-phosphate 3-phosphatidyltransferase
MGVRAARSPVLGEIPNVLSTLRLLAVPVLFALAIAHSETAFAWLLIAAMLTDIADGWIARRFHLETTRGAFLDSVADAALTLTWIYGVWVFHREVMTQHAILCGTAAGLWVLEDVLALLRYGRLSSFHTYLSKIAANALGIFIGVLFVIGYYPWLFHLAIGLTILSGVEEIVLVGALREWRTDVRGLWWVLNEKERR